MQQSWIESSRVACSFSVVSGIMGTSLLYPCEPFIVYNFQCCPHDTGACGISDTGRVACWNWNSYFFLWEQNRATLGNDGRSGYLVKEWNANYRWISSASCPHMRIYGNISCVGAPMNWWPRTVEEFCYMIEEEKEMGRKTISISIGKLVLNRSSRDGNLRCELLHRLLFTQLGLR